MKQRRRWATNRRHNGINFHELERIVADMHDALPMLDRNVIENVLLECSNDVAHAQEILFEQAQQAERVRALKPKAAGPSLLDIMNEEARKPIKKLKKQKETAPKRLIQFIEDAEDSENMNVAQSKVNGASNVRVIEVPCENHTYRAPHVIDGCALRSTILENNDSSSIVMTKDLQNSLAYTTDVQTQPSADEDWTYFYEALDEMQNPVCKIDESGETLFEFISEMFPTLDAVIIRSVVDTKKTLPVAVECLLEMSEGAGLFHSNQSNANKFVSFSQLQKREEEQFSRQELQKTEQQSTMHRSVLPIVNDPARGNFANSVKLALLYKAFPEVERDTIDATFLFNEHDSEQTMQHLEEIFPGSRVDLTTTQHAEAPRRIKTSDSSSEISTCAQLRLLDNYTSDELHELDSQIDTVLSQYDPSAAIQTNSRHVMLGHARMRLSLYQAAASAFARGQGAYAYELKKRGEHETAEMEKFNRASMFEIFRAHNIKLDSTKIIDLHHLYVQEVEYILPYVFSRLIAREVRKIQLMIGKGIHSRRGQRLQPAVVQLLTLLCLRFTINEDNIDVTLWPLSTNYQYK